MNQLDEAMRVLIDRDARPITFEEIADPRVRRGRRPSPALVAIACAAAVVVAAAGALVLRESATNGAHTPAPATVGDGQSDVYTQPSESMSPTLRANDRYTVDAYGSRTPARGDVVALHVPAASQITDRTQLLVKRIVGLPGETIEGRDGRLLVDGNLLDESAYLAPSVQSTTFGPVAIPEGMYFVLGDNRQYSNDSTIFGPVARSEILGTVNKVG